LLAIPAHVLAYAEPVGENHIRLRLRAPDGAFINGICFRCVGQPLGNFLLDSRGRALHVAGNIAIDRFQGEARVQLRVCDASAA
jgi:single-stranded-DNA-specific exonuclease